MYLEGVESNYYELFEMKQDQLTWSDIQSKFVATFASKQEKEMLLSKLYNKVQMSEKP